MTEHSKREWLFEENYFHFEYFFYRALLYARTWGFWTNVILYINLSG